MNGFKDGKVLESNRRASNDTLGIKKNCKESGTPEQIVWDGWSLSISGDLWEQIT